MNLPARAVSGAKTSAMAPASSARATASGTELPQSRTRPAAPAQSRSKHSLRWPLTWGLLVAALIVWGMHAQLERYITPQRGVGYWLGIVGGSMMLLLLVYSARKRAPWLRWIGGIPAWFQIHMVLGVVGPLLVLFHANFRLGATNSNVALICMLIVAGSGVVGRYIYTRIHAHLDGNEDSLEDLQGVAERIRAQTTKLTFLPGLLDAIDREEQRIARPQEGFFGGVLRIFTAGMRAALARWRLHRLIEQAVARAINHDAEGISRHARRIAQVARDYADRRLDAARRVAEYRLYARLFSLWHLFHIPLFFMLLIAGIAHVIAVNIY